MKNKIGVVIVHGIGQHKNSYADQFINQVKNKISLMEQDPDRIIFKPVYWHDVLQEREQELIDDLISPYELKFENLRKFLISTVGDAIAYMGIRNKYNPVYDKIHKKIHQKIQELAEESGQEKTPLVAMAFSLGTMIMSNYIWDRQHPDSKNDPFGKTAFERMESLCGFITMGSNIPLFTLTIDKKDVKAIDFPAPQLPDKWKSKAKWLNYYMREDVLSFPIKPTSESYNKIVTEDVRLQGNGLLTAWNPASHLEYIRGRSTSKPVADYLCELLKVE